MVHYTMVEIDPIVANDFTQVPSDGIGVWCNDDGKAELVSVFTYYCPLVTIVQAAEKLEQRTETTPMENMDHLLKVNML